VTARLKNFFVRPEVKALLEESSISVVQVGVTNPPRLVTLYLRLALELSTPLGEVSPVAAVSVVGEVVEEKGA
jgi:hypothetical protein